MTTQFVGVGNVLGRENDYGLIRTPKKVREQIIDRLPPARFSPKFRHKRISDLAYKKWQNAGSPEGRSVEFWLAAEKEIEAEYRTYRRRRGYYH